MGHKITLGSRPKTFSRVVTVPLHEGVEGQLDVTFRYRTRTEFGKLVDDMAAAADVTPPKSDADEDVVFSLRAALEASRDRNADYLLQVLDGWGLPEPFDRPHVQQLCDELPGAALALIEAYRQACAEGRLGN